MFSQGGELDTSSLCKAKLFKRLKLNYNVLNKHKIQTLIGKNIDFCLFIKLNCITKIAHMKSRYVTVKEYHYDTINFNFWESDP